MTRGQLLFDYYKRTNINNCVLHNLFLHSQNYPVFDPRIMHLFKVELIKIYFPVDSTDNMILIKKLILVLT